MSLETNKLAVGHGASRGPSRRDFLKLAIDFSFKWGEVAYISRNNIFKFITNLEINRTQDLIADIQKNGIEAGPTDIPSYLRGFYVNMSYTYLWESDEKEMVSYIDRAKELGAKRARIFIGDRFEPETLGSYDPTVLDKLADFAKKLQDKGLGLEIDFYDGYQLGNGALKQNFVYPPMEKITSPYNITKDRDGYRRFFEDKDLKEKFKERIQTIKKLIGQAFEKKGVNKSIIHAWSVMNEADPNLIGPEGQEILTKWYEEMMPVITEDNDGVPILTGLIRPWDIDISRIKQKIINTIHLYPPAIELLVLLFDYLKDHHEPIVVQEFGFPYNVLGIPLSKQFYKVADWEFVHDIVFHMIEKGADGKYHARVSSFGGWKISPRKSNEDNMSLEEEKVSNQTSDLIGVLSMIK